MTVKELLSPLNSGVTVSIFDREGNKLHSGGCYGLWANLPHSLSSAEVVSFHPTFDKTIEIEIETPVVTNFDKLKELFPHIYRQPLGYNTGCELIVGLDGSTKYRKEWLDAEYTGKDNE